MTTAIPDWLRWAREIQAISQTGSHYAADHFDAERYQRLAAIAAEMFASHTDLPPDELTREFQGLTGYTTPRVDVRAAVFNDQGHLLLVQDWQDHTWSLPGGWADVGDVPSEAAEREALEETGFDVKVCKVIGVYDANRVDGALDLYHAYKLIYLCNLIHGEARTSDETVAVDFFSQDALPGPLGSRTTGQQIEHAFQHRADPALPTFFD